MFPFFHAKFLHLKFSGGNFFDGCLCVFTCSSGYFMPSTSWPRFHLLFWEPPRLIRGSFLSRFPAYAQCLYSDTEPRSHVSLLWWLHRSRRAPFSKSSYSSIIKLSYAKALLKIPSRVSEKNIIIDINIRHTIKNRSCSTVWAKYLAHIDMLTNHFR